MHRRAVALALAAAACASTQERVEVVAPEEVTAAPRPARPRARPEGEALGLEALRNQLQALRSVPADSAAIPAEARPYLRAMRWGLREWLMQRVRANQGVAPRTVLRVELDAAELTATRAGEDLAWGSVSRLDVLAPGEGFTAVVLGLRLGCTSDDALYVFRGPTLVMELAQDRWVSPADGRGDLRVIAARASRLEGVLMVTSRAARCGARFQEVRFEGISEGTAPERPLPRWDLRQSVDALGACGGFDEATLGMEVTRNGFEMRGCAPTDDGGARERRARYRFVHGGIELVER